LAEITQPVLGGNTGKLLWNSAASSDDRGLQLGGTALPHPDNWSFIINVGDDPIFLVNTKPELRGPFSLSIALKVTPVNQTVMEIIHNHFQSALVGARTRSRLLGKSSRPLHKSSPVLRRSGMQWQLN
jgi:hypothetical protein